nr:PIN domain-containing protein [Halorhodospira halochloris]
MRTTVIYDACVLYPAPLRDFLLRLAVSGFFAAKWTERIHDEWIHSVLRDRPELQNQLVRTRALMNKAVPDCLVEGYEQLESCLDLPDPDDRHVLAAAIRVGAQNIITFNLDDFPAEALGCQDLTDHIPAYGINRGAPPGTRHLRVLRTQAPRRPQRDAKLLLPRRQYRQWPRHPMPAYRRRGSP